MKRYRLNQLPEVTEGHFLSGILPGRYLCQGALSYKPPGFRTHTNDGPGGQDLHVHADDCEAFVILQGKAVMEVNGERIPLTTGDVVVIEPGEDHHLVSDREDPCINLWLHAGPERHPDQQ
ncbi:MAG: cupin domain-containing protein [Armatimonadetes bacterium]|jgi:mannose-6-phosphate isomerase-like protein (cupin superfamily)|nr:cupin domain-containing protein [Armatimonadota bacterium]